MTCSPSPRDFGDWVVLKDSIIKYLDYAEQNGYLKILIQWLREKKSVGGGLANLQFYWLLKKGTIAFNFR